MLKRIIILAILGGTIVSPAYSSDVLVKSVSKGPVSIQLHKNPYSNEYPPAIFVFNSKTNKQYQIRRDDDLTGLYDILLPIMSSYDSPDVLRKMDYSNLSTLYLMIAYSPNSCTVVKLTWSSGVYYYDTFQPDRPISCSAKNIKIY